jgi:hypothetical protein
VPISHQAKVLIGREFALIKNDPGIHIGRVMRFGDECSVVVADPVRFAIIGTICGALYFDLPLSTSGIFSRAGLIYFILLFAGMSVFATVPAMMEK